MKTRHLWFGSGNYSLLGHLDVPQEDCVGTGVVIVPPFGWEEVCSYRPLRFMAQTFARMGFPTLRYDLPGTGDSSGGAQDPGLFESWINSVEDAACELRYSAGVENVTVVGIHLGAILALIAASRGADFQAMALWGPAARGRTILRELRALANIERAESLAEQDAPPQPIPGFVASGFLIAPEMQRALEDLDISALSWPRFKRILLLSRDDLPPDAKLIAALQRSAANVHMAAGHGYSAMMAAPQEAQCPEDTSRRIAEFLTRGSRPRARRDPARASAAGATIVGDCPPNECFESIYRIETSALSMFGILAEPASGVPRSDACVLYLNPGGVRHIGPNRMWVESARRWAPQGVISLRLDLQSIGESEGDQYLDVPSLYREEQMRQIEVAIDSLRVRTGVKRFVAIGLCSGACWGFHAAVRSPDIRAAILLNPSLLYWDPGADRRRIFRDLAGGYSRWAEWTQLVRSRIQRGDIERAVCRLAERLGRRRTRQTGYLQMPFETAALAWSFFERGQKRVTLVFRDGEPLLAELEAAGELPLGTNCFARCVRVPNGGHTFRPLWAQKLVHDLIDDQLASVMGAAPPAWEQPPDDRDVSPKAVRA
jgi:pimeloyl-ACP methyl ester carboxylesterase